MKSIFWGLLLAMGGIPSLSLAIPSSPLDLKKMAENSDAIVAGSILNVTAAGRVQRSFSGQSVTVEQYRASVRCERVLKGNIAPGSTISVVFDWSRELLLPIVPLTKDDFALLFVKLNVADQTYSLTDPLHGKDVAVSQSSAHSSDTPVLQKLEDEFISVIQRGSPVQALAAIDRLLNLKSQRLRDDKSVILSTVKDPEVQAAVQGAGLALDIEAGKPDALQAVLNLPSDVTDRQSYQAWQHYLLQSISQVTNTDSVPIMNELLVGKSAAVRKEASRALETLADSRSTPFLKRGLGDPDVETAYNCLVALSRLTGKQGPDRETFEKNRAALQQMWQQ